METRKNFQVRTPVGVIGMGKSGESALDLLLAFGIPRTEIKTFDQKVATADFQRSAEFCKLGLNTLVVSPGVPLTTGWIQDLLESGAELTSELSLACQVLKQEKIIGITGSVGKSTTTAALGVAAIAIDPAAFVGGNLGIPLSQYAADVLTKNRKRAQYIILELSSFQLENCPGLRLHHSIITFLSPNHLERYRNLEHYYQIKFKITKITDGRNIFNQNGGDLPHIYQKFVAPDAQPYWSSPDRIVPSAIDLSKASLIGIHNRDNLALAWTILEMEAWPEKAKHALLNFTGLDHRLQKVGEFKNILFINDSKATALDSVLIAVDSCAKLKRAGRIHLLLGGRDKNLPWRDLAPLEIYPELRFYFFGECREQAKSQSQLEGDSFAKLGDALKKVFSDCQPGDTVLLSPGGTSMDEFKNFEERGRFFEREVKRHFVT